MDGFNQYFLKNGHILFPSMILNINSESQSAAAPTDAAKVNGAADLSGAAIEAPHSRALC